MRISPHIRTFYPPAAIAPTLAPSTELRNQAKLPAYPRSPGIVTPRHANGGTIGPAPEAHGTRPIAAAASAACSSVVPDSDTDQLAGRRNSHRPRWWSASLPSAVSGPGCALLGTAIRVGDSPPVLDSDAGREQETFPATLLPHPPQSIRSSLDNAADCSVIVRSGRAPPVPACFPLRIDHPSQPRWGKAKRESSTSDALFFSVFPRVCE